MCSICTSICLWPKSIGAIPYNVIFSWIVVRIEDMTRCKLTSFHKKLNVSSSNSSHFPPWSCLGGETLLQPVVVLRFTQDALALGGTSNVKSISGTSKQGKIIH